MDWSCTQVEESVSDFLEGALRPDDASAFSQHLPGCPDCARLLAHVRDLTHGMHALPVVPEPPQLAARIIAATAPSQRGGWRGWYGWFSAVWQPQFAMGVATVALSALFVLHAVAPDARNMTAADWAPGALARSVNRRAHLAYAHGVKFVNDMRLVYEIQSLFSAPQAASEPASPASVAPPTPPGPALDPRQKTNFIQQQNPVLGQRAARDRLGVFLAFNRPPSFESTRSFR